MAIASSAAAIFAASRLNHWYVRTLGTSLVLQAPDLGRSDTEGHLTRRMLLKVRSAAKLPSAAATPSDEVDDARALREGSREARDRGAVERRRVCSAGLVSHVIPLLAGPLSDYAVFALRKVAEERVGQLTDALLDPGHDYKIRRQLARVLSVGVSQRAADALLLALDDERFDVRFQCARSLAAIRRAGIPEFASIAIGFWKSFFGKPRSGGRSGQAAACSTASSTSRRSTNSCAIARGRASPTCSRCCLSSCQANRSRSPSEASTVRTAAFEGPPSSTSKACFPPRFGERLWPFLVEKRRHHPCPATRRSHRRTPSLQLLGHPARRRRHNSRRLQLQLRATA